MNKNLILINLKEAKEQLETIDERDYEIKDAIEKGREHYKSQSFDQHILELYNEGIITKESAKDYATSASDLELKMSGLGSNNDVKAPSTSSESNMEDAKNDDIFDLK